MKVIITFYIILNFYALTVNADELMKKGSGKIGFWIGSNSTKIFDKETISYIAEKAGAVVLNVPVEAEEEKYNLKNIINELHSSQPGLPVFFYTWPTRWYKGIRVGTSTLDGYQKLGDLLIHDKAGKLITGRDGKLFYGDVRNKEYRKWVIEKIQKMLLITGADGVALDNATRFPPNQVKHLCKSVTNYCKDYADGVDSFFKELRRVIHPKLILFNGLWNQYPGQLKEQEKLLVYADAVVIEWFGRYPFKEPPPFNEGILPYLNVIRAYPNKLFMVFGRGSWTNYDKKFDEVWEKYLYSSYLLVVGKNTLYKYHASFQVPPHAGLSGGLTYYNDWDIDIGSPTGDMIKVCDGYLREFDKAVVYVNTMEQRSYILKKHNQ